MSASDCEAVPNDTTLLAGCAAVLMCWWMGGMGVCGCAALVRTERKSLARVLTPQCFGSVSLSLAMHAAMPFVCLLLPPPLCVWALLRAPPPIDLKSAACHMSSDTVTRLAGSVLCCWTGGMGVCVRLVRTVCKSLARVLTPSALDLSLCVSCSACCDAICVVAALAPPVCVCMGVAESAAADWPQVLCVICHLTRPHGWLARCCAAGLVGWVCVRLW